MATPEEVRAYSHRDERLDRARSGATWWLLFYAAIVVWGTFAGADSIKDIAIAALP